MLQNYAIIDGVNVINIIQYKEQPSNPPEGFEGNIIAVQSDLAGPGWTYVNGQFIDSYVPLVPTQEELIAQCKATAKAILNSTDWTQANDCPLVNKADFTAYRAIVRTFAINPVANAVFPELPVEQWT